MSTENVSAQQLKQYIERIETLEEEKRCIADDVMESAARQEAEALMETYKAALGL